MAFTPHHIDGRGPGFGYVYNRDESKRVGYSLDTDGEPGLHIWAARYFPHGNWVPTPVDFGRAEAFLKDYEAAIREGYGRALALQNQRKEQASGVDAAR